MHERLDTILKLQKMCLNELEQTQTNSERYSSNISLLTEQVKRNWQGTTNSFLMEYDTLITNITAIMDVARKFNLQMHLHNMKLSDMQIIFSKLFQKEKLQSDSTSLLKEHQTDLYPAEECDINSEETEDFSYPRLNLTEVYKKMDVIAGRVTYIQNLKDLSFYIFHKNSEHLETIVELAKSLELRQYHNLPKSNEVFGYVLDKHIFRAVLSSKHFYDVEMNKTILPCYLLDTGEMLPLNADNIMYRLSHEQKSIPAQALRCQLSTTNKNPFVDQHEMEEKLKALEYENCTHFKIVAIERNTLYVEIADKPDKAVNEYALQKITLENVATNSGSNKVDGKQLTEYELEMLYEEPLNTSNAMKAIMGYDPQDDKRICRFYDSKSGGCFKGANCRLEHTLRQPDGWTKDVLPASSIMDSRHPTTVFPTGSIINITPTYVGRLDRFYALINDPYQNTTPLVWNDEDIPSWKLLKKPPHMFELVLSRYIDGLWYRAKIMSHDDDYKMFKVLYIDYGNYQMVHLRNLASMEISTAQLPFQAVLCRFEAVNEKQSNSPKECKNGVEKLCEMILNKSMDVKVISHYEDLFISFVDKNEYPLPDALIDMGLLEYSRI